MSTVEEAATPSLSKNSGDHFEMVIEENLQYPDPDDDFENFETGTLINSPTCITLSSNFAYTKHRSRITVPVRKLKRPNSVFSEYIEQDESPYDGTLSVSLALKTSGFLRQCRNARQCMGGE